MTVHKKHPADASAFVKTSAGAKAMADKSVDKKAMAGKEVKPEEVKTAAYGEPKEPVIVSDVVTETTERIEVIEEADPLSNFKEKMVEEEFSENNAPKKNYMWPILLIFIITILLLIGAFLYKSGTNIKDKINIVPLSPTPTIVPEPTKAIDLTKYEIEIQNGSGVSGEASRQEASLEAAGFIVSSVGNADNSDYTDTVIKAKTGVEKAYLDKLKSVLGETFTLEGVETLPDDSLTSVVVILGVKK